MTINKNLSKLEGVVQLVTDPSPSNLFDLLDKFTHLTNLTDMAINLDQLKQFKNIPHTGETESLDMCSYKHWYKTIKNTIKNNKL